jgi:hypothetical protein
MVLRAQVEPFCHPWLFNPWSQCSLGEAMIVVGCVVGSSDHGQGNAYSSWFFKYAPVWAGIVVSCHEHFLNDWTFIFKERR